MNEAILTGLRLATSTTAPRATEKPLADLPLTVLVGVTGAGKSTALGVLTSAPSAPLRVLPDRREVTDAVMILPVTGKAVSDREERFQLTAAYREQHPGGMAQALGSLVVDTAVWGEQLVFDGLRGLDEVKYAAEHFPAWRFVALGAPDLVRVRRLLGRDDQFDQVRETAKAADLISALDALDGIEAVFSREQRLELAELVNEGHTPEDILAKTRIVVSERQHYDPAATEAYFQTLPASRALVLDTVRLNPSEVAQAVEAWR